VVQLFIAFHCVYVFVNSCGRFFSAERERVKMSTELFTEPRLSANIMNDSMLRGPADLAYDSNQSAAIGMANDFIPQGPEDMAQNAESFGQPSMANDFESHGKPENDFCEFQYIEIVPLDSPKQAENNNEGNCSGAVKEEVKEEPEDVCIILTLLQQQLLLLLLLNHVVV